MTTYTEGHLTPDDNLHRTTTHTGHNHTHRMKISWEQAHTAHTKTQQPHHATLGKSCKAKLERGRLTGAGAERVIHWQLTCPNPLNHRDNFSRPALRHGTLNSRFQVALYLPSKQVKIVPGDELKLHWSDGIRKWSGKHPHLYTLIPRSENLHLKP